MHFFHELLIAFCLFLVIEGVMPFLFPHRWRLLVERLATIHDKTLRISGLLCMLIGLGLLYLLQ